MGAKRSYLPALATLLFILAGILFIILATRSATAAVPPLHSRSDAPALTDTPTPTCELAWRAVTSPNPGANVNLNGVHALSAKDLWAVGGYSNGLQLLTMHWDGAQWAVIPNPNPGGNYYNILNAVSGVASNDVWAVGFYRRFSPNSLIMHWDGVSWSYDSGPYPGSIPFLNAVAAISANDVWAAGYSGTNISLINHWNGSAWSVVPSPSIGVLHGVSGSGPTDAWAVGDNGILHWNGAAWTVSPSPNFGIVRDVDSLSATDAWAVADNGILHWNGAKWIITTSNGGASLDAIAANDVWVAGTSGMLHWDGTTWSTVLSPYGGMASISAASASDVWAVGVNAALPVTERYAYECPQGTSTPTPTTTAIITPIPTNTATNTPTNTITPTATPTCGPPAWNVETSPNVGLGDNFLYSIAAASPTDIWAVGYSCNGDCTNSPPQTLVERWNGTTWSVVPSPNVGTESNSLLGVAVASANDVWAVGSRTTSGIAQTLIERWNGTTWSVVTSPNAGTGFNNLSGVAVISALDAWAVGTYTNGSNVSQTLVEHWNGSAWNIISSPSVGTETNMFNGASAASANDVWAVGVYFTAGVRRTLIERWNGAAWSVVPSPNVGSSPNYLIGVSAVSANNAWAVGYYSISGNVTQTLVEHWNGSAWSVVNSPNVGTGPNYLRGVTASDSDFWAVGYYCNGSCGSSPYQTLVLRSSGIAPSANVGTGYNYLYGVTATSANDAWTVGYYRNAASVYQTLTERWHSVPCPSPAPTFTPGITGTPGATFTPSSPTATGTAPAISPTVTPVTVTTTATTCPISFSDVQSTDYFYAAVRYLYCAGVISGYADNTFRPFNNTTRGQLSKIVALAKGWMLECPSIAHFTDVPVGSAFFCYVETAFSHGVISGYADGTFRPGNNVTRAQLCKIIVQAQQWPIDPHGGPHFTDVAETDPFYGFIETAYNRGVISGYADRTFRPGNSATRGQICKIVYQAITQTTAPPHP